DFDDHVKDFMAHLSSKNQSKHTLSFYKAKLMNWRRELDIIGLPARVHDINLRAIEAFVHHHVHMKGLRYSSAANTLRGVKAFANYLEKTGVIETHGFHEFVIGESNAKPIETFNESDIFRLLEQIDPKRFTGIRDYMIKLTFLETGMRLRELCDLKLADVDFDKDIRKGSKSPLRPISSSFRQGASPILKDPRRISDGRHFYYAGRWTDSRAVGSRYAPEIWKASEYY